MPPKVSVIMPSRARAEARESIGSVMAQSVADVELIIIMDPRREVESLPRGWVSDERIRVEEPRYLSYPDYPSGRIATLRNFGIGLATGQYIAHLDDDNWWSGDHLDSLCRILDGDPTLGFAHSWRTIIDETGRPLGLTTYPWSSRFRNNDQIFLKFVECGIATEGQPFLRDVLVTDTGEEIFHVDTSELCIRREVQTRFPFRERFTLRQIIEGYGEDRAICEELYRAGIRYSCSGEYTLFYRLGGYSNHGVPRTKSCAGQHNLIWR